MPKKTALKHIPHEKWKESDKRRVVAVYKSLGVATKTAEITGIPIQTVRYWQKQDWWVEYMNQLRQEDSMELEAAATEVAKLAQDVVKDRLINGDFVLGKDGEIIRKPVSMRDAAVVNAINLDKRKILQQEPERLEQQSSGERLLKLMEQFVKFNKAKEINRVIEKEERIVDAEFQELQEGLQTGSSDGIRSEEGIPEATGPSSPGNDKGRLSQEA